MQTFFAFVIRTLLIVATLLGLTSAAYAAMPGDEETFDSAPVGDDTLDSVRGGAFFIGSVRIDFSYFAQLSTQIPGQSLETIQLASFGTQGSQPTNPNNPVQTIQFINNTQSVNPTQIINNAEIAQAAANVNLNQVINIVVTGLMQNQLSAQQQQALTAALANRKF